MQLYLILSPLIVITKFFINKLKYPWLFRSIVYLFYILYYLYGYWLDITIDKHSGVFILFFFPEPKLLFI